MAEIVTLLPETSFTSVYLEEAGCFLMDVPAEIVLVAGKTYTVRFDSMDYPCTCLDVSAALGDGTVGLGNGSAFGIPGNEPFAITWLTGEPEIVVYCFTDTAPTAHTISISGEMEDAAEEPEEPEKPKILLTDYAGTQQEYALPQRLRVDTSDGGTTDFVHESLVATPVETVIEPDFSGGDMVVTPEEGQAFSQVSIPVPENLVPENIAEGVDIAGIVGAMQAGGKDVKIAVGSFTGNGSSIIVNHNLGVVPDVFVAYCTGAYQLSGTKSESSPVAIGVSRAFKDKYGVETSRYGITPYSTTSVITEKTTLYGIDDSGDTRWIYSATTAKITLGGNYVKTFSSKYEWIAIGGLA